MVNDQSPPVPGRHRVRRALIWIASIKLTLLAAFGIWYLLAHFVYFNLHEVVPGQVYRSAQPSPAFLQHMAAEKGIRSVLKFNRTKESDWSRAESDKAERLGLDFHFLPMGVAELPSRQDLLAMIEVVRDARRPLLIHCKTGADRSGVASVLADMAAGGTFVEARQRQIGLKFLHTGHIGPDIEDVFDVYIQDQARRGMPTGGFDEFSAWARQHYWPDYYRAHIEPMEPVVRGHPGERRRLAVRVTNAAQVPWESPRGRDFFLQLQSPGTREPYYPEPLGNAPLGKRLAPGESMVVQVEFEMPDLPPGTYDYTLDVMERRITSFSQRGSELGRVRIEVAGAADAPGG